MRYLWPRLPTLFGPLELFLYLLALGLLGSIFVACCAPECRADGVVITTPGVTLSRPPQSIAIWYQAGCGDSDKFLADWPQIEKLLHERRIGWSRIDVAVPVNCAAARINGITRLPAISVGGRWVQGYTGLESFLQQLAIAHKKHTPPPARPPSPLPPVSRQRVQEAANTSAFDAALKGLRDDQAALRSEWQAAITDWNGFADEWQTSLDGLQQRVSDHAQQIDERLAAQQREQQDRWRATEAGLVAVAQTQQAVADVTAQVSELRSQIAESARKPEPAAGFPSPGEIAHPAGSGGGTGLAGNKEFHAPDSPRGEFLGKWARFGAFAAKVGLAVAAPEVSLPLAGISAAGTLAGWMFRRRARPARGPHQRTAPPAATGSGRPEVRPDETFPRIYVPPATTQPGPWEQRDNGTRVRSAGGGSVPDRFATINPDGAD